MAFHKKQICIVGGGVIGFSVANHLQETFPNVVITVMADRFTPNTLASDKSGALILPPTDDTFSPEYLARYGRWFAGSLKHYHKLYNSEDGGKVGINYISGYVVNPIECENERKWWENLVTGFRRLDEDECKRWPYFKGKEVIHCSTYVVSAREYLPWLMKKFIKLGGITIEKKVHSLSELHSFNVIVNCAGLGAWELANDSKVYPVRGHMVSVKAPWVKEWVYKEVHPSTYIFPCPNDVILGSTDENENENLETDSVEIQGIMDRCSGIVPSLANAQIRDSWVGIRPVRKGGVRLEKEEPPPGATRHPVIVHCYGHGHSGVTLSWGCAEEVVEIIGKSIHNSKL